MIDILARLRWIWLECGDKVALVMVAVVVLWLALAALARREDRC